MDDPRDLTLADMAALRDLDEEGDGDVFDALVGVEIPERFQLSDASQELSDFLTLFLRRVYRRGPFIKRAVELALAEALNDYCNQTAGDLPPAS